jgi:ATP-dependent Lhr-like helicase
LSGIEKVELWFQRQKWEPAEFQRDLWRAYTAGDNGLLVAPTGSGKTYAVWGAVVADAHERRISSGGLRALWITPLRALATDIGAALSRMNVDTHLDWEVALRTGDTSSSVKKRQREVLPEVLVTTPESLHVMLSYPGSSKLFEGLEVIVADEWHELMGSKRGVMLELALARLSQLSPALRVWGVSATIGNLEEARDVLLSGQPRSSVLVRDPRPKELATVIEIPDDMERFPWSGHLGERMTDRVVNIIRRGGSTLVFTNTRGQAEIWYQRVLAAAPDLAGRLAIHHGSLSQSERTWVETALHEGRLAAVISTSSLDLGVDFRPVDTVIQIGGPKGVARFVQRAGRSGHRPGASSVIHFIPTNALELIEAAALRQSILSGDIEAKPAIRLPFDLLSQWLVTLACGDGFRPDRLYEEVCSSYSFRSLDADAWAWTLQFLEFGGVLHNYPQYQKLSRDEGLLVARDKEIVKLHRMHIGVITSAVSLKVQYVSGKLIGTVEESFLTGIKAGQTFWFAGRSLEYVRLRGMTLYVKSAPPKKAPSPRWDGGRLPLSSNLAAELRRQVGYLGSGNAPADIKEALSPIVAIQSDWSEVPHPDQLLVESITSREGHHLFIFPFEGRAVHEVLGALLATRLGDGQSYSLAMNDYGFELLAAEPFAVAADELQQLFDVGDLSADLAQALSDGTMARRQFRGIAEIAGLITTGYPGKPVTGRHLQASSDMVYEVLATYDPANKLLGQARDEVLAQVYNLERLIGTLDRLADSQIRITHPPKFTPLAFGIMVDRLRERLSGEALDARLERMLQEEERYADNI